MRILLVSTRFPLPAHKGDQLIAWQRIKTLAAEHELTLVALSDRAVPDHLAAEVKRYCREVHVVVKHPVARLMTLLFMTLFSRWPLQVSYYFSRTMQRLIDRLEQRDQFDAVHGMLLRSVPYLTRRVRPVILELVDAMTLNLKEKLRTTSGWMRPVMFIELQRIQSYERSALNKFTHKIVVADRDRIALQQTAPESIISVIPNGVDIRQFQPSVSLAHGDERRLIFTGNLSYSPNQDAIRHFVEEVWPLVRQHDANCEFHIVGAQPPRWIRDLDGIKNIRVHANVPSMADHLRQATLAVMPLRAASGIQNKVLEAMASGVPCVVTESAAAGMRGIVGTHFALAQTAKDFAREILQLLDNPDLRRRMAEAARQLVMQRYSWEAGAGLIGQMYVAAVRTQATPALARSLRQQLVGHAIDEPV